jgi:hypothetical protein
MNWSFASYCAGAVCLGFACWKLRQWSKESRKEEETLLLAARVLVEHSFLLIPLSARDVFGVLLPAVLASGRLWGCPMFHLEWYREGEADVIALWSTPRDFAEPEDYGLLIFQCRFADDSPLPGMLLLRSGGEEYRLVEARTVREMLERMVRLISYDRPREIAHVA